MQFTFDIKHQIDKSADYVLDKLPSCIGNALREFMINNKISIINEIRICKEMFISLLYKNVQMSINVFISKKILEEIK